MSQSTSTGSFWRCPSCQKHVPSRQDTCRCGFQRSQAPKLAHEVRVGASAQASNKSERSAPSLGGIAGATVMVLLLIGTGYWGYRSFNAPPPPAPEDSELARKIRDARAKSQQPQVVYVPVPAPSQPMRAPAEQARQPLAPVAQPAAQPAIPPSMPTVSAPPATLESETDIRRRAGAEQFERDIAQLSDKSDRADIAWNRFSAGMPRGNNDGQRLCRSGRSKLDWRRRGIRYDHALA